MEERTKFINNTTQNINAPQRRNNLMQMSQKPQMPTIVELPDISDILLGTSSSANSTSQTQQTQQIAQKTGQIIIGPVVWDHIYVFEKKSYDNSDGSVDKKYTITLIMKKDDTDNEGRIINGMRAAYDVGCEQFGENWCSSEEICEKISSSLFLEGDKDFPDKSLYQGSYYIRAKSTKPPVVIDLRGQLINSSTPIFSGARGNALITFRPYDVNGSKGIACYLDALQLIQNAPYPENINNIITAFRDFNSGV